MAEEKKTGVEEQLVVFDLGNEYYGVNIASVHEIIRMQEITEIPHAPDFVEGITNLRGQVIPVIDVRKRFGLPAVEQTKYTRIVVVEINGQRVGMIVDGVSEVRSINTDIIEPPSPILVSVDCDYLRGIAKLEEEERLIILLDLEKILSNSAKSSLDAFGSDLDEEMISA